jgi:SET domain-containing protein
LPRPTPSRVSHIQGKLGNDARFINHSCNPNLEVRKYQTIGDGYEEFEIGTWATRDIKAGEEVSLRCQDLRLRL